MAYLKNIENGAVTDWLAPDSAEYQQLAKVRTTEAIKIPGTGGFGAGSGGEYPDVAANTPIWQEIAYEDTAWPDPTGGRARVILCGGATKNTEEISQEAFSPPVVGKIEKAYYIPFAECGETGGTNYRTITALEYRVVKEAPAEKGALLEEKALVKVALKEKVLKAYTQTAMTVEASAEIKAGPAAVAGTISPITVKSVATAGEITDPGGLVIVVYKRK